MRVLAWLAASAVLLLWTAGAQAGDVLDRAAERGGLIAAAVPDQLPLAAGDSADKLHGFDIDVAREIATRMGLEIEFVTPGWQPILAGNWEGKWDFSVSSITPTEARAEKLDFPSIYRFDAATLVVHKDNETITQPADVSGKTIGVKRDTTFESYLRRDLQIFRGQEGIEYLISDAKIKQFADKEEALIALAKGDGKELDAVVTSFATARAAITDGAPLRLVPGFLFFEPVAVAIDKGDADFAREIDRVVLEMSADGTLTELSMKWFGIDLTRMME